MQFFNPEYFIYPENIKTVSVDDELIDVLEMLTKYNLIALPVLDEDDLMAGIVTVDDILEHYLPRMLKSWR